ncbi:hypothetical protein ABT356_36485, partial [Streptosporangium roseum]
MNATSTQRSPLCWRTRRATRNSSASSSAEAEGAVTSTARGPAGGGEKIGLDDVESQGYCFQVDLTLRTVRNGLRVA